MWIASLKQKRHSDHKKKRKKTKNFSALLPAVLTSSIYSSFSIYTLYKTFYNIRKQIQIENVFQLFVIFQYNRDIQYLFSLKNLFNVQFSMLFFFLLSIYYVCVFDFTRWCTAKFFFYSYRKKNIFTYWGHRKFHRNLLHYIRSFIFG